ncbi:hypothetical protein [Endozoicomonas euniceicola]|uniref:Uncharacterized protein n=1 Tax=Endozoicomonas euniceicola TaxID=1234143 RepID=A0ABY6GWS4_9GAMM|nr:hypothetical protein [Endozoicomonas euniceicola]UYM17219.1 hypothetical protein NX720_04655 [Endozoicomonas euniceicola]
MFCEILVAQNQTTHEGSGNGCGCLTTVSTYSAEAQILQALSLSEDEDLSDLSDNAERVQGDGTLNLESPVEGVETIETIVRSYNDIVILVSNLDTGNMDAVTDFQQVRALYIAYWQQQGRVIWVAYTNRIRAPDEFTELTSAGFDIIIQHGSSDMIIFCRNQSSHRNIAERLMAQGTETTGEHLVVIRDLSVQLSRQLTSFVDELRRYNLIRNDSEGLILSNRCSPDDCERLIAVFGRLHLGTLFRVGINPQTRDFEIEIPTTQDVVVHGVMRAVLSEASFVIFELRFRRPDVGNDDGYMADDESNGC